MHAGQLQTRAHGGSTWVASGFISRTDAPDPACCTIAGGRSTWKCFGSRVGYLPERHAGTHAAQSRACTQRGNVLGRERDYPPDGRTGTRMPGNRGRTLRGDAFGSRAGLSAGHVRRNAHTAQSRKPRSPLKYTGLRVSATVVIPPDPALPTSHAGTLTVENHSASSGPRRRISTCMRIRRCDDGCTQRKRDRPAILAGQGSPADPGTDTHR